MPVHDWSRIEAGIFHDFHHAWIEEIKRALNGGLLPDDFYALAEQKTAQGIPDVLTLQSTAPLPMVTDSVENTEDDSSPEVNVLLAPPEVALTDETDAIFYASKQKHVVVRHVSGDEVIAVIEVVSRGNKNSQYAFDSMIKKSLDLLNQGIHLLLLDLHPPGPRDPEGLHTALWTALSGKEIAKPDKPLTLAAYEAVNEGYTKAYVEPIRVGDELPNMPVFLRPGAHVPLPLEGTYQRAVDAMPKRWRTVLEQS